jgi:hypothetical protein
MRGRFSYQTLFAGMVGVRGLLSILRSGAQPKAERSKNERSKNLE